MRHALGATCGASTDIGIDSVFAIRTPLDVYEQHYWRMLGRMHHLALTGLRVDQAGFAAEPDKLRTSRTGHADIVPKKDAPASGKAAES